MNQIVTETMPNVFYRLVERAHVNEEDARILVESAQRNQPLRRGELQQLVYSVLDEKRPLEAADAAHRVGLKVVTAASANGALRRLWRNGLVRRTGSRGRYGYTRIPLPEEAPVPKRGPVPEARQEKDIEELFVKRRPASKEQTLEDVRNRILEMEKAFANLKEEFHKAQLTMDSLTGTALRLHRELSDGEAQDG